MKQYRCYFEKASYAMYTEHEHGSYDVTVGTHKYARHKIGFFSDGSPGISEEERLERIQDIRERILLAGLMIVDERRVHDERFDKEGERSVYQVAFRPCASQREAVQLTEKIGDILSARGLDVPENAVVVDH